MLFPLHVFMNLSLQKEDAKLVIVGKQSIDSDNGQVGQMLASLLNWSQGTFASKLAFSADNAVLSCSFILVLVFPYLIGYSFFFLDCDCG